MNTEERYLLSCLHGFVQGEDPGEFSGDWGALYHLANIHSVTGILGYMVKQHPNASNSDAISPLWGICMRTIAMQSQRAAYMQRLIGQLTQAGIDHLLMKGYVVREYYPEPELRTFGDIDFLIREEDREACDALMMELGFERKTDWEPVYSYLRGAEYYEIHTDVMEVDVSDKADYSSYFSHTWERAQHMGGHTWELRPEDHLIYLLTHIAKHISASGAGIRMYLDIAFFLKHFAGQLDLAYLQAEFEKLAFADFVNMVFTVVQTQFDVESPIPLKAVDTAVLDNFMDFTMAGGVFGHFGRDSGLINLKKDDRNEETVSRGRTLRRRLFPSAQAIESRYTYLQGKHWLLPVAWAHRLIRTHDTWGAHAEEAKSILNADEDEVLKLKRIYKEIGL